MYLTAEAGQGSYKGGSKQLTISTKKGTCKQRAKNNQNSLQCNLTENKVIAAWGKSIVCSEKSLSWLGYVHRMNNSRNAKEVIGGKLERREKERPRIWMDGVKPDLQELGIVNW